VAAIACFFLTMGSCSPDSTSSTGLDQGNADRVEPQDRVSPEPSLDEPEESVESSPVEAGQVVKGQEPVASPQEDTEEPVETDRVALLKGLPQAAKENTVNQPVSDVSRSGETLASKYFPLVRGASWKYRLQVINEDNEVLSEAVVERVVDGTKTIEGKDYFRLATTTVSGTKMPAPDQHYRLTDEGVHAAVEGVKGKELLVFPSDPASKQSWSDEAPPIIKRVDAKVTVGEKVTCGANVFSDCIRVDLELLMRGGSFFSPSEVTVRIERWFAPGVGMVRERRIAGGRTIEAVLEQHKS
jgi:hypothetical protein